MMGKLTIKSIEATSQPGKYFDGDGLYLHVTARGSKLWRGKYRYDGREKTASYGAYPEIGLKLARERHAAFRLQLAAGYDPLARRSSDKAAARIDREAIFSNVAWGWYKQAADALEWGERRQKTIRGYLNRHILPAFGDCDVRQISPREITALVQLLHQRGINYTAHECLETLQRIFAYAVRMELRETSPAAHLRDIIPTIPSTPYSHVIDPERIGQILLILERAPTIQVATKAVITLSPMLFTRPSELRQMRWDELEGDLWHIPAERMKQRRPMVIPLPHQAVEILDDLRLHTGHFDYVFANCRTGNPISEGAAQRLKIRQGLHNEITWHGWRHTASTLLNDRGYNRDYIEEQLSHRDGSVRGIYNHARYLEQRRKMLQDWADYLDQLKDQALIAERC